MGKPKFACEECGRDYQSKGAADRHIRDKHNGNAKRIPYVQLIADVKDGKKFEYITGGLPSKVRRPDLGYIVLEELCRAGARMIAMRNFPDAFSDHEQVRTAEKAVRGDFFVLKRLVTSLTEGGALENFHYSTLEDLINDDIRGREREAYLENELRSDELKSQQRRKESSKELSAGELVRESFNSPDFRKKIRTFFEGEKKDKS